MEEFVKIDKKRQNNGAVLTDYKILEVSASSVEGASMSLHEEKWQVCQFLAAQYPFDVEESLERYPEEMASINVLPEDLEWKLIET